MCCTCSCMCLLGAGGGDQQGPSAHPVAPQEPEPPAWDPAPPSRSHQLALGEKAPVPAATGHDHSPRISGGFSMRRQAPGHRRPTAPPPPCLALGLDPSAPLRLNGAGARMGDPGGQGPSPSCCRAVRSAGWGC